MNFKKELSPSKPLLYTTQLPPAKTANRNFWDLIFDRENEPDLVFSPK